MELDKVLKELLAEKALLNYKSLLAGSLTHYCCACGEQLRMKSGGKAGKDFENARWKFIDMRWRWTEDQVWAMKVPLTKHFFLAGLVCEPCNKELFMNRI